MYMCCIICSFEIVTSFNSSDLCIDENDVRVLKKSLTSEIWGLFSWLKYLKVQTNQAWTFWKKVKFAYKSVVVSTYKRYAQRHIRKENKLIWNRVYLFQFYWINWLLIKWSAKELHIFNILQRYKHQARCFVVHALPEINARRPMVYIDCTLTMQVLFKKIK